MDIFEITALPAKDAPQTKDHDESALGVFASLLKDAVARVDDASPDSGADSHHQDFTGGSSGTPGDGADASATAPDGGTASDGMVFEFASVPTDEIAVGDAGAASVEVVEAGTPVGAVNPASVPNPAPSANGSAAQAAAIFGEDRALPTVAQGQPNSAGVIPAVEGVIPAVNGASPPGLGGNLIPGGGIETALSTGRTGSNNSASETAGGRVAGTLPSTANPTPSLPVSAAVAALAAQAAVVVDPEGEPIMPLNAPRTGGAPSASAVPQGADVPVEQLALAGSLAASARPAPAASSQNTNGNAAQRSTAAVKSDTAGVTPGAVGGASNATTPAVSATLTPAAVEPAAHSHVLFAQAGEAPAAIPLSGDAPLSDGALTAAGTTASSTSASAAAHAAPAPRASVPTTPGAQLAIHITRAVQDGLHRVSLRLHPAELGRVNVELEITADGRVQAMVTAEKQDTLDMLQRESRLLEKALQDAGLKTNSDSLTFNLRGEQRDGAHETAEAEADAPGSADEADAEPADATTAGVTIVSDRALDIRV